MGKQRRKNNDNAKNKKTAIAMSDPDCIVNLPTDDSDTPEVSSRSRWYFQPYGKDLSCTSDYMPPVMAGVTQQWSVDIKHLNRGLYWPVLGISFNKVDLKSLSSIVFHVHVDNPKFLIVPQPYKEVITKQQLKEMYCEKGIVRWKLHRQFDSSNYNGTMPLLLVDMEICLDGDSSEQHFPKLHYFELQSCSIENFMKGTPLRAHKPYLWSIDVEHREADTDPGPALPAKIMHSAISGNGERAATLSTTNRHVYLDLWDLSSVNNSLLTANEAECWNTGNHSPSWCTGEQFSFLDSSITESQIQPLESGAVSISWSGIFVAVFRTIQDGQTKELIVFKYSAPCSHDMSMDQRGKSSGFSTLQRCNNLFDFHGEGTFHISDTNCPQEENELFIACDGTSVRIYEVHRGWSHVCTVPLSVSASFFIGEPTIALQGKFFAWFRNKGQVFIWDIEESALAAVVNVLDMEGACLAFSSDASMIAVSQGGTITNYWTGSGTAIGKFVSGPKIRTIGLTFIHNGSQILVNCSNARDSVQEISGYILDATSMTQLDTFFNPGQYFRKGKDRCKDIGSQELYVSHGSTLDKIRLEDYLCLTSPTSPADLPSSTSPPGPIICRCNCKDGDTSGFYELSDNVTSTSSSGLLFSYTFNIPPDDAAVKTHTFTLTISQYGSQRELITIPPFALTKYTGYYKSAHFLDGLPQLLLYSDEIVIVLELPETFLGDCKILQVYWLQDKPYWDVDNNALQLYERLGLLSCKHQKQLLLWLYHYNIDDEPIQVQVPLDRPHDCDYGFEFASAVVGLVEMYKNSNDTCKRAIFHYLEAHINRYPNPSNLLDCVLGKVLEAWPTARKTCEDLLVSLLSPESTRWIPRPDYCQGSNPLWVTLEMSRKDPLAMNLFKTFMQYCLRRAHEEEDHFFITPLVACLPELCDEERPHQEIALDILQRMAYIPVKKSSYVVDNHIIAHPPEMKMLFKKDSERLLYKCNNPILQLHLSSEPRNVQNDNFIDGIFKASFDMLWVDKDLARSKNSRSFESSSWLVKTGLYTLVSIAWYSFNPCSRVSVVPHTAHSEFFDNPALAALIEYKWNTIGFKLWLTRFIVQSIYYILVLTASLVQVYRSYDTLFHVYIAIATFSGIFLWLEFVQLLERPWVYISSPYNMADLVAFGLPMIASISHLLGHNDEGVIVLSFAVLFISLHLLFELRTIRSVCYYTTIIIQIISRIRVFFFIFACGIMAFSIAILHMVHACSNDECMKAPFPKHFFYALSATYFFMAGRYDSVNDLLNEPENWTLHLMMMIYVLFTVILMLNVLIALINTGFTESETWVQTWLVNRLRYVESAENLSYHIAGFRRKYNWFPKAIYYTASEQQVSAFMKRIDNMETSKENDSIQSRLSNISSAVDQLKANMVISGPSNKRHSKDEDKDHLPSSIGATERMQTLECHVEELKVQLTTSQAHMDRRIDDIQKQMKQISDLLLKALPSEE